MPSIDSLVGVAESLKKRPLLVDSERCVVVRHRQAKCRACVDACMAGALAVSAGELRFNPSKCVGCGACAVVCPTEALQSTQPPEDNLIAAAQSQAQTCGRSVFACARVCANERVDAAKVCEVSCLARVDEAAVVSAAAAGAQTVLLVDGNCSTCKFRATEPLIEDVVSCSQAFLDAAESSAIVERDCVIPEDALLTEDEEANQTGSSRRNFLSDAVAQARDITKSATEAALAQELGNKGAASTIEFGHNPCEEGAFPTFTMPRRDALVNALFELGIPDSATIESLSFGNVSIVTDVCNGCGVCAFFCPTGALRRDKPEESRTKSRFLEFNASECVQCGLCVNVCWKRACQLSPSVPASQLFDFDPVVFRLDAGKSSNPAV